MLDFLQHFSLLFVDRSGLLAKQHPDVAGRHAERGGELVRDERKGLWKSVVFGAHTELCGMSSRLTKAFSASGRRPSRRDQTSTLTRGPPIVKLVRATERVCP